MSELNETVLPKLRICMLTDCYPPAIGGIEAHVYSLAAQLAHQGQHVEVVTHRAHRSATAEAWGQDAVDASLPNVLVHRLDGLVVSVRGEDPVLDPRAVHRVGGLLRAGQYDIIHGHSFGSLLSLAGLRLGRRMGLPTVVTKHSMTLGRGSPVLAELLRRLEYWMARRWADSVIAVSTACAAEMDGVGLPVFTIPGGVDCSRWRPDMQARQRVRNSLGYGPDQVVIGYLSRLAPSKGVMALPALAQRLLRLLPGVRFLVVGGGPQYASLQARIEELGLREYFAVLGPKPWNEAPAYLNAMDVFVFPSRTEAFGLALAEAMACGVPPVARRSAGAVEINQHEETGYLVTSDDELFERVLELARQPELRRCMGARARNRVEQHYEWKAIAALTVEAYAATARRTT